MTSTLLNNFKCQGITLYNPKQHKKAREARGQDPKSYHLKKNKVSKILTCVYAFLFSKFFIRNHLSSFADFFFFLKKLAYRVHLTPQALLTDNFQTGKCNAYLISQGWFSTFNAVSSLQKPFLLEFMAYKGST